ncbi:MAG TPA: hypothetical protein VGQ62_02835 [Chloroflexota bacterium]|nr:hypothetical protein [Chloroflexota bacterium]
MPFLATGVVFLVLSSFLASTVEMVEALTIVLAVGVSRQWRSTLIGVAVALVALAAVVAALGPALALIPINALRVLVGALLLIFGLQWLRKAILRASGRVALHNEEAIYQRELAASLSADAVAPAGMDWYAFTLAFKGVFLEGLEVVFIVLTFGANAAADGTGSVQLAAVGAIIAAVLVTAVGAFVREPLSRVPENKMKFVVGAMLTTFGIFWGSEGVGVLWPGQDIAILAILAFVLVTALIGVRVLRERSQVPVSMHAAATTAK